MRSSLMLFKLTSVVVFRVLVMALVIISTVNCGFDEDTVVTEKVSYRAHIYPLLSAHCVACHEGGGSLGGVELDSYLTAYASRIPNACTSVAPDLLETYASALQADCSGFDVLSMPVGAKSKMSRDEQRLLLEWIAQGGQE